MPISETAQKNHEELFPNHESTLKVTDPELCALTPQFYGRGANFFDRRYVWPYKGLIVGTDPVAVDAIGAHLLQAKRVAFFGEDRALDVTPIHIMAADKTYHLGVSDLTRIQLIKLGWTEEVLI